MREVDTDALLVVAPSLGIANPATATRPVRFDDENLQQVWDASKFGRFPRVTGYNRQTLATAGPNDEARAQATYEDLFANQGYDGALAGAGLNPSNTDCYVLGIQAQVSQTGLANFDESMAGFREAAPDNPGTGNFIIAHQSDGQVDGTVGLIASGGSLPVQNNIEPPDDLAVYPNIITPASPNVDVLAWMVRSGPGGASTVTFIFKLHFTLAGVPLWYTP